MKPIATPLSVFAIHFRVALFLFLSTGAFAQTSSITYQGTLERWRTVANGGVRLAVQVV